MANRPDKSGILIGVVAAVMLVGGGWAVVKQYQKRKAQAEVRDAVASAAELWIDARTCLTNRPPGTLIGEPAELRAEMARRRDQSMALSPATERYPYTCLAKTREVVEMLSHLDPTLEWVAVSLDEQSSASPYGSRRLAALVELVTQIDTAIERLWSEHRGEGLPYPDQLDQPPAWDSEVLPAFPPTEECPPTAVNLDIGVEHPRTASIGFELGEMTLRATETPGVLEAMAPVEPGRFDWTIQLGVENRIERVRACRGSETRVHALAGTATEVVWVALDPPNSHFADRVIEDEALATAFRGEDGRTVQVACDELGPSIAYAADGETRLWVCGQSGCESAAPLPIGLPRLGLARLNLRTMLLSYPPESRVAVVDGYDHIEPAVERRVVPTIDDRANPELLTENGRFVLRLCGAELHAEPDALEFVLPRE